MLNNDIIRCTRKALYLNDSVATAIFKLVGHSTNPEELKKLMIKEGEPGFEPAPAPLVSSFLDGLIIYKRGPKPGSAGKPQPAKSKLTNNDVLKKIRIALEIHEDTMLEIFNAGEKPVTASELTALFRKPGHKHYKECGDQYMRAFFRGLSSYVSDSKSAHN
ncbi:MAG: DUF1456 family protein [Fibrobacteres bacterium]|nr:DUF1456 family protein [Fibrobacterota bacterium]